MFKRAHIKGCWQGSLRGCHHDDDNDDNSAECAAEALLVKTVLKCSREDWLGDVPVSRHRLFCHIGCISLCCTLAGNNRTWSKCLYVTHSGDQLNTPLYFLLLLPPSLVNLALHDILPIVSAVTRTGAPTLQVKCA